jgi:hypothetical protein
VHEVRFAAREECTLLLKNEAPHGDDDEIRKKSQNHPPYFMAMETGAVGLLAHMCNCSSMHQAFFVLTF